MAKRKHKRNASTTRSPQVQTQRIIMSGALLDILILVHRKFDLVSQCLDAIPKAAGDVKYKIILWDNGSPPEEADIFYAPRNDANLKIFRNRENLGFPMGCNYAFRQGSSPLIFFLNDDVILQPDSISKMVNEFNDPKIGVVGMKLIFPEYTDLPQTNNMRPAGKIQHIGLASNIHGDFVHQFIGWSPDHPKVNAMRDVYAVTGAAMMTRRGLFKQAGMFYEGYGQGCLIGETLIPTEFGIIKLRDLMSVQNKDECGMAKPINIKIASEYDNRIANIAYLNGLEKTLKITTEKDFSIQGTLNHKIRVMSEAGEIIWKQLNELRIGDYLAIRCGTNLFGNNNLNADDAYLAGLYIAEGSNEKYKDKYVYRVTITNADKEIGEFLQNKYHFTLGGDNIHWRRGGKDFCAWMSNYVDFSKKAITKEIPTFFLQANKETQIAFLRGLFDGDGCAVHDGRVAYSSSSHILIKQLQAMLLNFGIVVGIYPRMSGGGETNPKYGLNYLLDFGSWSKKFYSDIGFRLVRKQSRKEHVRPILSPNIPHQRKHFKRLYSELDDKNWKNLGMHDNNPATGVRRNTIELLINQAFENGKTWLDKGLEHFGDILLYNCVWLKVKSIEDGGEELTYDLHVPTNHAYIANGFISHNTWEDVDFCLTVRRMGYNIIVVPEAVGVHHTGATATTYKMGFPLNENKLIFMQRWAKNLEWSEFLHV